jgi:LacI family transcriptional regulator
MMRHLAGLGHTRIAFISGPATNADARERLRGYRAAIAAGVVRASGAPSAPETRRKRGPREERIEFPGDFTERTGHDAVKQILAREPRPTAIFAANDSMAVGALSALRDAGLDVPRQMSVVGFDDIPIARYVNPPLTTIHVDIAELGRRAFAVLLEVLAHPKARLKRERIETSLVVRKSSGKQGETS